MPWPQELEDQLPTQDDDQPGGNEEELDRDEEGDDEEDEEQEGSQQQATDYASIRLDGEDIPQELRGRSVRDAVQQYNTVLTHARTLAQQLQGQVRNGQQQQTPPEPEKPVFEDDDLLGDASNFENKLNTYFQKRVSPYVQQQLQSQAMQARQLAMQQFPDEFKRWGGEIDQYAGSLNLQQIANPQTWMQLVQYVKANHLDDIVQERVQEAQQQPRKRPPPSERGRAPAHSGKKKKGEITAEERQVMQLLGLDEETWKAYNG